MTFAAFLSDVRFGGRLMVKTPLTTVAAILSLALGIGGTTVMFSAVDAVLVRPLPYPRSDRLVLVSASSALSSGRSDSRRGGDLSPADFLDSRQSASFQGMASISTSSMRLTGDGAPEQIRAAQVSANFFELLGAQAIAGRVFLPADDAPGSSPQALLSEEIWRRRYGAGSSVIGRMLTVSDQQIEVVGVVPRSFRFETDVDVWILGDGGVPRFSSIPNLAQNRDVHILTVVGRLRDSVSRESAQAELDAVAARLAKEHPIDAGWGIVLDPLKTALVGDTRRVLVLLLGAVALMLLIASVNVANLAMVRTQARTLELAMRTALGASPSRLARQILAENLLLAFCGGLLGVGLAVWGVNVLVRLAPAGLPRVHEIAVNGRLAAFASIVTAVVGLGFGLWPAWRASSAPLASAIATGTRSTAGRKHRQSQMLLVSSELAVAQVLLVGAGLLLASLARLTAVNPGFDAHDLVAVDVSLPGTKYHDPAVRVRFHEGILETLRGTAGIDRASMAMRAPMTAAITRGVWIDGRPAPLPGELQTMSFVTVSEDYFSTAGIRLLRGRPVVREDDSRSRDVVVVNEAFSRRYFSGQDPIGRRIGYGPRDDPRYWRTVVGLVADSRERLSESAQPTAYAPFRQDREPWNMASYLVKSSMPVTAAGDVVRRAVFAADPDQPVSRVRAIESDVRESIALQRFTTLLAALFAAVAFLLAVVGTFGMMSHVVRGRTGEIGVRMALGASQRDIIVLVLGHAGRVVLAAIIVGLTAAVLLSSSVRALLYGVQPTDPTTLALTAIALMSAALGSSYIPLRRVLAQNPLRSLRTE